MAPGSISFVLAIAAASMVPPADAVQRAFVASYGSDANAATGCGFAGPCRSFAAAVPVVDSGGEVLALDSIGYGIVTIDKSITLTAAPGIYAGIAVPAGGVGVTIATPGVNVTLRGLTINGPGGNAGVYMTHGSRLSVENCVISSLTGTTAAAVWVNTAAKVRIIDSLFSNNKFGALLGGGATADIANSKFLRNMFGGISVGAPPSGTTTAAVADSVVTGSGVGVGARSQWAAGTARVSVIRTALTNQGAGVRADSDAGGTAVATVSDSLVTGNTLGLVQQGAGAVLETLGNNTVRKNTTDILGTITAVNPI
jgi:hypothetical protein